MPEYEGWRSLESSLKSLQSIIECASEEIFQSDFENVI